MKSYKTRFFIGLGPIFLVMLLHPLLGQPLTFWLAMASIMFVPCYYSYIFKDWKMLYEVGIPFLIFALLLSIAIPYRTKEDVVYQENFEVIKEYDACEDRGLGAIVIIEERESEKRLKLESEGALNAYYEGSLKFERTMWWNVYGFHNNTMLQRKNNERKNQ